MGISLDFIPTAFTLEDKVFTVPKIKSTFEMNYFSISHELDTFLFQTHCLFEDAGESELSFPHFDEKLFSYYKEKTDSFSPAFRKKMKNKRRPKTPLENWLLQQEGLMIGYCGGYFFSSEGCEKITKQIWKGYNSLHPKEDGRLILSALAHMQHIYHISIPDLKIYRGDFEDFSPESIEIVRKILQTDTVSAAFEAEQKLSSIQKREGDGLFEESVENFKKVLEMVKQGARFIYSV